MKWNKLGQVFCANEHSHLMKSGGRTPVALHLEKDLFRIYFASYDSFGRGRIFSLIIDINRPTHILDLKTEPIIELGDTGFYDDNGIIPSAIIKFQNKIFLYTIGFSVKNKLIFDAASGLAISQDGGITFKKLPGPVIDRTVDDPCFAASPDVIIDNGLFKMWYVSCSHWEKVGNSYRHFYTIRYKESVDGIYWDVRSRPAILFENQYEYAISRPAVIKEKDGRYNMWYSFRAQKEIDTYRIGWGVSADGKAWTRRDCEAGIDVSTSGWDSEMICYPHVFDHNGERFMLYNGNGYGKSGFGLAVLESV